jgi:uncharacterized repeat protein (TIGR01451 family)
MNNSYLTKFALSLLFLIGFGLKSNAQYYTIPDIYFALWIQTHHPTCIINNQLDTASADLLAIDSVDLYASGATNLDGIQFFSGLVSLRSNNYNVTIIPALPPNLRELQLNNSSITNWPVLPQSLRELQCNEANLTILPTLPDSLIRLECMSNQLTAIPPLPSTLLRLFCSDNPIGVLPPLPIHLTHLAAVSCGLSSLPANLPADLILLYVDYNQISALPAVLPPTLENLVFSYNPISVLPDLPNSLKYLECNGTLLTIIPELPPSFEWLDCSQSQLTELPDLPQSLRGLQCPGNQLTELPQLPDSLYSLAVSHNQLTSMPHLPSTLVFFRCDTNQISCFENLPENTQQLYTWYISGNPFTCVPTHRSYTGNKPVCTNSVWNNPYNCFSNYTHGIKGTVYTDQNFNCNADASDQAVGNVRINLLDNSGNFVALAYTDNFGGYYFEVPNGTYHVAVDTTGAAYSSVCTVESTVTVLNNLVDSVNFVIACANGDDLFVSAIAPTGIVFPGQTHNLLVFASNQFGNFPASCLDSISGEMTVSVSGPVTYTGIPAGFPQPSQVNGNTITYSISNFSNMNWEDPFQMNLLVDQTAQSGDSVCVSVTITSTNEAGTLSNNQMNTCYAVLNSYDPNIKEVFPTVVTPNYNDYLTYTIHFQNTGTAPAINIRLTDLIDPLMDPSTFELMHASDPVESKIQHDSLSFEFNNIWLADSASNEPESHGFVQYRIKPFAPLANGSNIENKAAIYFDFNAPIITNTAVTNVGYLSVDKSKKNDPLIYPNPGNGVFHIRFSESVEEVYVYTISGLQVAHETNPNLNWNLDLSSQPKGIYILKTNNGNQSAYSKLLKL